MKKIFLLGLVALGMLATGCSNEDEVNPVDPSGKLEGYMTLSLVGNSATRTTVGGDGTEIAESGEDAIENVTIVFTDANGIVTHVHKAGSTDIANNVVNKFEVAVGTYYVYALVNGNDVVPVAINEQIQRVIANYTAAEAALGFKDGKFLMVNERNPLTTNNGGVVVNVSTANTESNPAPATIKVDRVAVKIADKTTTTAVGTLETETNKTITDVDVLGFVTLNVNKQFNLVQKWEANGADNVLSTPLAATADDAGLADQYFNRVGKYTKITKTAGVVSAIEDLTIGVDPIPFNKLAYVTENRPGTIAFGEEYTSGAGETTGVIYKVQAKDATGNLGTFYSVRGLVYTKFADVAALPEFAGKTLDETKIPALRAAGIKVYQDGIMYYTHFIKGNNDQHLLGGKYYYGVFRNSVYNLNVKSISALGDDTPGGTTVTPENPNPPIDTEKTYIEVTVTPNPWVLNTIDIEF